MSILNISSNGSSMFSRQPSSIRLQSQSASWPERELMHRLKTCSLVGLGFGILLRLVQYFSNRSLWFDEVALVLNLLERSYVELLGTLSYNQAAPPLFLWIEKFALDLVGNNAYAEYALRFYPLLGGLLSLVIYYRFTQTWATGWARPIAIFLFSGLGYLVYFAGEVKPYSWDVTIGLLLFLAIANMATLQPPLKQVLATGLLGVVSIWLSFPSILVIAGVEAANVIQLKLWQLSGRQWRTFLLRRLPLYAAWLLSLGGLYFGIVTQTLAETGLSESWAARYPKNGFDLLWLLDSFGRFFYRPLGFLSPADGLAMVAFVAGFSYLYRTQKGRLAYLCSPFVVTLMAAYLHKYPFRDRLILFLVPYALIVLAEGIVWLIARWQRRPRALRLLGAALAISLLALPMGQTLPQLVRPGRAHFDDLRPAIAHIYNNWQPRDKLYVFPWSQLQFKYYQTRFDFPQADVVLSQINDFGLSQVEADDRQQFSQEMAGLRAGPLSDQPRVWFLLSRKNPEAETTILEWLDQLGTNVERSRYPSVVVSLQDLSS